MLDRVISYLPALLDGAQVTLALSLAAIALGFFGGVFLCSARDARIAIVTWFCEVYISFFRGTPMLVQLLMLFYIPPALGIELNPYVAATLALGMNSSAYQAEILRSGFVSIAPGQREAASIMGLSPWQTLWHIEIPQVVRRTLPSLISEMGDIVKGSAIVSVITVTDLMRVGRQLVSTTYRPMEVFILVALVYLLMVSIIQIGGRKIENRWKDRI